MIKKHLHLIIDTKAKKNLLSNKLKKNNSFAKEKNSKPSKTNKSLVLFQSKN